MDAFDKVMRSIEAAKEAGLDPVKINTVIIKGFNDDEMLDFVDFAERLGRAGPVHRVHALRR